MSFTSPDYLIKSEHMTAIPREYTEMILRVIRIVCDIHQLNETFHKIPQGPLIKDNNTWRKVLVNIFT